MILTSILMGRELHRVRQVRAEEDARVQRLAAEQRLRRRAERLAESVGHLNGRAAKAASRLAAH